MKFLLFILVSLGIAQFSFAGIVDDPQAHNTGECPEDESSGATEAHVNGLSLPLNCDAAIEAAHIAPGFGSNPFRDPLSGGSYSLDATGSSGTSRSSR
ncbi:MAG: hypothetical protein R2827_14810 [Bdellovibrionales bacterium]